MKIGVELINKRQTSSVSLFGQYTSNNKSRDPYIFFPYSGWGLEFSYKKYLKGFREIYNSRTLNRIMQGIYFAGFAQGGMYQGHYVYEPTVIDPNGLPFYFHNETISNIAGGFTFGINRLYWNLISLDIFVGAGLQASYVSMSGDKLNSYWNKNFPSVSDAGYYGIIPKGGLQLGIVLK